MSVKQSSTWKEEDLVPLHPESETITVGEDVFHVHFYKGDHYDTVATGTYVSNERHGRLFSYPERVTGLVARQLLLLHQRSVSFGHEMCLEHIRDFLDVPSRDEMRNAIDAAIEESTRGPRS